MNMGRKVNSNSVDQAPVVTPDQKYLFFSSRRQVIRDANKSRETTDIEQYGNGSSDIYWINAGIIDSLKSRVEKTTGEHESHYTR